ncbi:hypothetical protein PINS_up004313 [Pythium insidiosum]|nr:hypothetical protein PINS_up004313 [Pythium insidiosum]
MSTTSLAARVAVLGPQRSGRTRLVHALKGNYKAPSTSSTSSTSSTPSTPSTLHSRFGLSIHSVELIDDDRRLEVALWDFEGPTTFDAAYALFLSAQTLFLVTVDLDVYADKYKHTLDAHDHNAGAVLDEHVHGHVIYWIRYVVTRFANARVVIVGTKADLVTDKELLQNVEKDLEARLDRWKRALQDESEHHGRPSESSETPSNSTKNDQLNVLRRLEQQRAWLDKQDRRTWTTVSSSSANSVETLRTTLLKAIETTQLQQSVPIQVFDDLKSYRDDNEQRGIVKCKDLPSSLRFAGWDALVCLGELIPLQDNGFVVFRQLALVELVQDLLKFVAADRKNDSSDEESIRRRFSKLWRWKKTSNEKDRGNPESITIVAAGMVTHAELMEIPSWKRIQQDDLVSPIIAFMRARRFVFPRATRGGENPAVPGLIVPTRWRLNEQKRQDLSARYTQLVELIQLSPDISTTLHKASWEYEFNTRYLPRTFFEEAAVQCYGRKIQLQVNENDLLGGIVDESIFRIAVFSHRGGFVRHMIRVEVVAVTNALCAALLKWCCSVVETSIDEHEGLTPERYEIDERNGESTPVYKPDKLEEPEYPSLETQPNLGIPSPLTLCLDVRSVRESEKVKWKKRFLEWELVSNGNNENPRKKSMSYRRAPIMLDENSSPQWGTYSIYLTPAPAIKNLKDWRLQVTLRRNSVFCFGHIARGYLPLDKLSVSDDLSTFAAANMELTLETRKKQKIGIMVCHVSPEVEAAKF